jgi:hypothetical protein
MFVQYPQYWFTQQTPISQIPNQNTILQQNIQLNKQKVEQKLDLEYNTYALGRALSKAELYAFRFSLDKDKERDIRPLFGYYNQFDNGNIFEKDQLFKSLVNAVKFVHYGFEETEYKYKEIMFPDNMKKEEVIKYIRQLKTFLKEPKEIRIYDDLIKVLERLELDFSDYKDLYCKNQKIDQKKMMESFPGINKAFEAKEKKWKTRIENDPDYKPKFELEKNYDDNSEFQKEYFKKFDNK